MPSWRSICRTRPITPSRSSCQALEDGPDLPVAVGPIYALCQIRTNATQQNLHTGCWTAIPPNTQNELLAVRYLLTLEVAPWTRTRDWRRRDEDEDRKV